LEFLLKSIKFGGKGGNLLEIDETRIPKEKDIERAIELLDNILNDNYIERCGYKQDLRPLNEILVKQNNSNFYKSTDNPNHTKEELNIIFINANKLEKEEMEELMNIMKKIKEWWV